MAVRVATRDRIKSHVLAEGTTVDSFLGRLLDEHDERVFWLHQGEPLPSDRVSVADAGRLVGDESAEFVWRNGDGGFTFRYAAGSRYLTWVPGDQRGRLVDARERALWAHPYIRVPEFSDIRAGLGGWWTTSAALPGVSAVGEWGRAHPEQAVRAIAAGLRRLHQAPASACPFRWERNVDAAVARIQASDQWRGNPDSPFAQMPTAEAVAILRGGVGEPDEVVCHGDACSPNTILDGNGFVGLVDIGELGVADRWADLAVATWSIEWNYGPGWDVLFYQTYGIEPDDAKILFYRLLWAAN